MGDLAVASEGYKDRVVEPAGDVEPQRFSTIVREGDFSRNVSTSSKCRRLIWPRRLGSMGMCPST